MKAICHCRRCREVALSARRKTPKNLKTPTVVPARKPPTETNVGPVQATDVPYPVQDKAAKPGAVLPRPATVTRPTGAKPSQKVAPVQAGERKMDWLPEKQYRQEQKGLKKAKAARKKADAPQGSHLKIESKPGQTTVKIGGAAQRGAGQAVRHIINAVAPHMAEKGADPVIDNRRKKRTNPTGAKAPKGSAPAPLKSIGPIHVAPGGGSAAPAAPAGGGK